MTDQPPGGAPTPPSPSSPDRPPTGGSFPPQPTSGGPGGPPPGGFGPGGYGPVGSGPGGPGRPPGPPGPPAGGPVGWYSGPIPLTSLTPRESIGRAVGRTVAKTLAAVTTFGIAVFAMFLVLAVLASGLSGTPGGEDLPTDFVAGDEGNRNKLLAIPVTGIILGENEDDESFFASLQDATYGYDVQADLEEAAEREDIKGIVLEMDTPGGTIFGSKAIADAVSRYQERTGRPVLAYVRGLSASGGMYAMAGADRIVADHGTLVGSIGVIFGPISHYSGVVATEGGLLGGGVETTGGITQEYITAGRSKDLGNPYRALTDEERAVLQTGVDNNYQQFVEHVANGRAINPADVESDLGALIFDEQTALDKRLIDDIGNRDHAYASAAELAKLTTGNWQVVRVDRSGSGLLGLGALFGSRSESATDANRSSAAADVRHLLCGRGPVMMAYYGAVPAGCG